MARRLTFLLIMLATPVVLVMAAARLVMLPVFMQLEYTRPGFPVDIYGMTTEARLRYGPLGVEYIIYQHPLSFLAERTLPGHLCFPPATAPCPMFNEAELRHMHDVQVVTNALFVAGVAAALLIALAAFWLHRQGMSATLWHALATGAALLICLAAAAALAVLFAWDAFFEAFHALFFAYGTWRFLHSDTLIRLYPEQFWIDGATAIGALACLGAALILLLARSRLRQSSP